MSDFRSVTTRSMAGQNKDHEDELWDYIQRHHVGGILTQPRTFQLRALLKLFGHGRDMTRRAQLLMQHAQGAGKTLTALLAHVITRSAISPRNEDLLPYKQSQPLLELRNARKRPRTLIVCSRQIAENVWVPDIKKVQKKYVMNNQPVVFITSGAGLAAEYPPTKEFFIVSKSLLEGSSLTNMNNLLDLVGKHNISTCIFDELHTMTGALFKKAARISNEMSVVLGLTGTPLVNKPEDLLNAMSVVFGKENYTTLNLGRNGLILNAKHVMDDYINNTDVVTFFDIRKADPDGFGKLNLHVHVMKAVGGWTFDPLEFNTYNDIVKEVLGPGAEGAGDLEDIPEVLDLGGLPVTAMLTLIQQSSAKIAAILQCVEAAKDKNHTKIVVASHRLKTFELIDEMQKALAKDDHVLYKYSGDESQPDRQSALKTFSTATGDGKTHILLLSMGVGSEGLRLVHDEMEKKQQVHCVILGSLWWNLPKMQQLVSRVYRVGQKHESVDLYIPYLPGTFDEHVLRYVEEKNNRITYTQRRLETPFVEAPDAPSDYGSVALPRRSLKVLDDLKPLEESRRRGSNDLLTLALEEEHGHWLSVLEETVPRFMHDTRGLKVMEELLGAAAKAEAEREDASPLAQEAMTAEVQAQVSIGIRHFVTLDANGVVRHSSRRGLETLDGKFVAVSAGGFHSLALRDDGSVVCWGKNGKGQAPPEVREGSFAAVSAGVYHSLALRDDGSIVCWGDDTYRQSSPPRGKFKAVSAGYFHSLAIRTDGSVTCWGNNDGGQAPPEDRKGAFVAVSAGGFHSLALRDDGSVACWGRNAEKQAPPEGVKGDFTAISAGMFRSLALQKDGSVLCWGHDRAGKFTAPVKVQASVVAISAGAGASIALQQGGGVVVWGEDRESFGSNLTI